MRSRTESNEDRQRLSARQSEIAELVARGRSSREIGEGLHLSRRTVENHIAAIYDKLGVGSRAELVSALWRARVGAAEPGLGAARRVKTNLPAQRTSFVGREADTAAIATLFDGGRLVTVTGAGGMGKTRCAVAVGEALIEQMPAGVWLADLAPLAHGSHPASAVAQALNVQERPGGALLDALLTELSPKGLLLILDNCEHLIAKAAALADALLSGCPDLRILATSREPLRIAGEQIYRLPPLAVPAAGDLRTLHAEGAARYAAVQLFVQRARAGFGGFALTDGNAPIVADICRRLDGIPLAVELAAARANVLSLDALAARLDQRLEVLSASTRTARPRHQTMRALIDWSYDLLGPDEQQFFERLSAFSGGWNLEAAASIAQPIVDEGGVLALLASLVDKSLVIADVSGREPRYRLLESTRQYAREKLAARGEASTVARRHAEFFADVVERFEGGLANASDAQVARAVLDLDNWRAALHWALAEGDDPACGQRIAAASWSVWIDVSIVEGRRWVAIAYARCDARTPARLKLRLEVAEFAMAGSFGEWDAVIATAPRLSGTCRQLGAKLEAAYVAWWWSESLVCLGRVAESEPLLREALDLGRGLGHGRITARSLENIGFARSTDGDLSVARAAFTEALAILQDIGAEARTMGTMSGLAEAEFRHGNVQGAVELVEHALARQRDLPNRTHLVTLLINYAAYLIACDRFTEARGAAGEAVMLSQETGRNVYQAWAVQHLAAIAALTAGGRSALLRTAAQLLGYVDARIKALSSPREYTEQREYDRVLCVLRDALGENDLGSLMDVGALFSQNEALHYALEIEVGTK